jgi:hypothetical protein
MRQHQGVRRLKITDIYLRRRMRRRRGTSLGGGLLADAVGV